MRGSVTRILGLYLVISLLFYIGSSTDFNDTELYEGSPCQLSNGEGTGICTKLSECPHQIAAVRARRFNRLDRCGFDNFDEIVCCGSVKLKINPGNDNNQRPASRACAEYGNEVLPTDPSDEIGFYILGGVDAKANEFPFMAALGYHTTNTEDYPSGIKYTCGGTLISPKHVLTAAHCISNVNEERPFEVRFGSTILNSTSEEVQRIPVGSTKVHPGYRRNADYDDIAIITLQEPVRISSSVQPACLLTQSKKTLDKSKNETLVVIGWGATSLAGEGSVNLKKAAGISFVDTNECDVKYQNYKAKLLRGIENKMICAIDTNRTRAADSCWGDSGGPLLLFTESSYLLAGTTAFGQACGSSIPSVYMSVYDYIDWIEENVWPNDGGTQ